MKTVILLTQTLVALALLAIILLQAKGTGLGAAWGGSGSSYHSKRGAEKILFITTIVLAALFILVAIANVMVA